MQQMIGYSAIFAGFTYAATMVTNPIHAVSAAAITGAVYGILGERELPSITLLATSTITGWGATYAAFMLLSSPITYVPTMIIGSAIGVTVFTVCAVYTMIDIYLQRSKKIKVIPYMGNPLENPA